MKKNFPIIIEQDRDGVYIVNCPVLTGCRSYGETIQDAIDNIKEAIELCLLDESQETDETLTFIGLRDLELAVV